MNSVIKQQLSLCKVADVPSFDDTTTELIIKKKSVKNGVSVAEGHCYLIELEDYILHPNDNFNLHKNWNNNIVPTYKTYKCECIKIMGKFIKIYGVGYNSETHVDTSDIWSGWLPIDGITVLGEI